MYKSFNIITILIVFENVMYHCTWCLDTGVLPLVHISCVQVSGYVTNGSYVATYNNYQTMHNAGCM